MVHHYKPQCSFPVYLVDHCDILLFLGVTGKISKMASGARDRRKSYMTQGLLAQRLRELRAQRGLTLIQAAKQLGVDRHTLRRIELGTQSPIYPTLARIAEGYGVEVTELLRLQEAPQGWVEAGASYPAPFDPSLETPIPPFDFLFPSTEESEVVEIRIARGDLIETLRRLKNGDLSVQEAAVVLEKMPVRQRGQIDPKRRG